jgi:NADH-quinone oxidoreductase subunit G
MINIKGRLQRLNRALQPPGEARDDWEIIRDLIQQLTGSNGIYLIEDVFKQIADTIPEMKGLSFSRIGDTGVQLVDETEEARAAAVTV